MDGKWDYNLYKIEVNMLDIDAYLQRIHVWKGSVPSLSFLKELQEQHMLTVPFENLDVIHKIPIPLNVESYYQKVIEQKRGGFCYELNGLFHWLLENLGFSCHLAAGTIQRPDGNWALLESHAAQIVYLDQPYLVDVGFGDSARNPLPLSGEEREDVSGKYRVFHVRDNLFDIQKAVEKNKWRTLYRFDMQEKELKDFTEVCHFNQTSPDSHFTKKRIVTLAIETGRITLSGNELTETSHDEKRKIPINDSNLQQVLEKYFGIYM